MQAYPKNTSSSYIISNSLRMLEFPENKECQNSQLTESLSTTVKMCKTFAFNILRPTSLKGNNYSINGGVG